MKILFWLGLWIIVSFPVAVLVGRFLKSADDSEEVEAMRKHATQREREEAIHRREIRNLKRQAKKRGTVEGAGA